MNAALLLDLGRSRRRLVLGMLTGLTALIVMYLALFPLVGLTVAAGAAGGARFVRRDLQL